jgi:hypothetical protein
MWRVVLDLATSFIERQINDEKTAYIFFLINTAFAGSKPAMRKYGGLC